MLLLHLILIGLVDDKQQTGDQLKTQGDVAPGKGMYANFWELMEKKEHCVIITMGYTSAL